MSRSLTHLNRRGEASMVDVSSKPAVRREAVAVGRIVMQADTVKRIRENSFKKGDVLCVARIAAIQAAKQTQHLIPLCHQIPLAKVKIDFELQAKAVAITATAITTAPTGVEMEALTAVSLATLTIYDMCKAVDKKMRIEGIKLLKKTKAEA
jgi:cyclic pyranopterin phosphate synthase